MSTAITPQSAGAISPLADVAEQAKDYARGAKAPNTWRAYAADWRDFVSWCAAHDLPSLPAAP